MEMELEAQKCQYIYQSEIDLTFQGQYSYTTCSPCSWTNFETTNQYKNQIAEKCELSGSTKHSRA